MNELVTLYRAEWRYDGEGFGGFVNMQSYSVIRSTSKMHIIRIGTHSEKRVPKNGKNIFAFDSKEKAMDNLLHRRRNYRAILKFQIAANNIAIDKIEQQLKKILEIPEKEI